MKYQAMLHWSVALTVVATATLQGCVKNHHNDVLVASCPNVEVFVHEHVQVDFSHSYARYELSTLVAPSHERKPIEMEREGAYRIPAVGDPLKLLRTPTDADYQLYFSPSVFTRREYEASASCIASHLQGIRDKLAAEVSRNPIEHFPNFHRVLPSIAVLRYAEFSKIARRFECSSNVTITVRPSGLVYVKRFAPGGRPSQENLIGYLIYAEHELVLDTRIDLLNDIPTFSTQCKQADGSSLGQLYDIRRAHRSDVLKGLEIQREKTQLLSDITGVTAHE